MTLGEIIREYRRSRDMTMRDFEKASGISRAYISLLERNKSAHSNEPVVPSVEIVRKVAKAMFIDFDTLFAMLEDDSMIKLDEEIKSKRSVTIPILGKVAAGIPIEAVEDILGEEEIPDVLAHTGKFFALKIKGDSMAPKIENGSIVVVRQQDDAETGNIVIALVNGDDAICKKLIKSDSGITLSSLNPAYDPIFYSHEDMEKLPVRIVGRVVEIRTKC